MTLNRNCQLALSCHDRKGCITPQMFAISSDLDRWARSMRFILCLLCIFRCIYMVQSCAIPPGISQTCITVCWCL